MVGATKKRISFKEKSIKNFIVDGDKVLKPELDTPKEKRAVIYCRVSSKKQVDEGWGLETQEEISRQYCEKNGIIVDKVFWEEGVSGNKQDREEFNKCVEYIAKKNSTQQRITHFVCRDLSRISRPDLDDIGAAFELERKVKQYGVEIIDIQGGTKDETDLDKLAKTLSYTFAGYQRKQIYNMCLAGRIGRLLQGYRPFSAPPLGYKRVMVGGKNNYVDEIDRPVASILKEGLELFANDPNMSQAELHKFLLSKGFKSRKSYLEKMFQVHRLYFYAGYVIYPPRDVNQLIVGQHEGFISLETANKIKEKLQKKAPVIKRQKKEDDNFVLKHLITCSGCGRKLTGWTTTKSNGQKYYYYGCQKEGCPERVNIPKEKLENQLFEMIKQCELPEPMKRLFDETLDSVRGDTEKNWDKIVDGKKIRLQAVKDKKRLIQDNMLDNRISEKLKESFYEQWEELNIEEEMIEEELRNNIVLKTNRNSSIQKIKEFIRNPLIFEINHHNDTRLMTQLLEVRFGNSLTCSKSGGVQTNDELVLYNVLRDLSQNSTVSYQGWDSNPHDREVTRFGV